MCVCSSCDAHPHQHGVAAVVAAVKHHEALQPEFPANNISSSFMLVLLPHVHVPCVAQEVSHLTGPTAPLRGSQHSFGDFSCLAFVD
jgi:hypothetical protein